MSSHQHIQFLNSKEIDRSRYDECIANSVNSLIYARSFYLDHICPQWSALVCENYSWVMPVTWKKKWGFNYLYQPPFCQQLGVFAKDFSTIPSREISELLKGRYSFWEISLNYASPTNLSKSNFQTSACANYILDLSISYENISSNYHNDLRKNLKRSKRFNLNYCVTDNYIKAIDEYIIYYSSRMPHVTTNDYDRFKKLCKDAKQQNMIICREVLNDKSELLAIALFLKDSKRLYNIMNTTTEAGRKVEANHFLLDRVIQEFAGSELLLDFEGSDLPGVKSFYENFGSVNQPYFKVKYNNLPWPLRLLK